MHYLPRVTCFVISGGGEPEGGGCEACLLAGSQAYGADVNTDGSIDDVDVEYFTDALLAGSSAADFDGDEAITSTDTQLFLESIVSGG